VGFSFRSGVVVLVAFAFLIRMFIGLDVAGFVVPYFFFALLAVALSRVDEVSILPNSSRVPFTGFWVGSTVAAVAILTFLGLLLAVFFVGGGLSRSLQWLFPVFLVLQIVVAGIGAFLLMILDWIMTQMSVDLSAFGEGLREVFARLGGLFVFAPPAPPSAAASQTRPLILGIMQAVITVVIPASMIALVLLLTWRRLQRRRTDQGLDEARESLFTVGAVARNLKAMLQDGMGRLAELAGLVGRLGPGSRFLAAISIRRIYANLVRLATELGYPRSKAQTPYEYLIILEEALPDSEAEVELITEAYVNAHYGQVPDTREELQRIRDSWERVRAETTRKQRPDGA
jgi:multisubunit Na+/H+ antiporter MnhC subunit